MAFNVVKFFEATITWKAINATSTVPNGTTASGSMSVASMSYEPQLEVAAIRTHPVYSAYNNWSRLIVLVIMRNKEIPGILHAFLSYENGTLTTRGSGWEDI